MFILFNSTCVPFKFSSCPDAGQPVAGGSFRRRWWFRCRLCPRSWLHPVVLHESIPSPPQQSAGLHGHAPIPWPSPPPPSASPSWHQWPLLAPWLPRRPRVPFHWGAWCRIQANGPGGAADESQRARQHPLLAYMTTTVPVPPLCTDWAKAYYIPDP